jgi:hypothetical protein
MRRAWISCALVPEPITQAVYREWEEVQGESKEQRENKRKQEEVLG